MKIVGLITEYNPFHNGHQYHIQKSLEVTGADAAIVVMSGDSRHYAKASSCGNGIKMRCLCSL